MRTGTAAALAVAALAALPAGAGAKGFSYGVTSSEVTSSSALIWSRSDKVGNVKLVVSPDKKFGNKGDKSKSLSAKKAADNVVQVTMRGLKAGHRYAYRFTQGKNKSVVGHFITAPKASQAKTLKFAFSGDTDAQKAVGQSKPFYNNFEVFKQMAKEGNNFNVNFGDTIYSDTEVGSTVEGGAFMPAQPTAVSVPQKWAKYKQNLKLKNLQAVRAATGMYNHWDDHEFINDFTPPENGTQIYNAGVTAFRSYMPVTYSAKKGIYRSFKWGKNAEVFFLDERSFRSPKASAGRHRRARPRADGAEARARQVRHRHPVARAAGRAGVPRRDQQPRVDDDRRRAVRALHGGDQGLDGQVQDRHERGADPAVLRTPV